MAICSLLVNDGLDPLNQLLENELSKFGCTSDRRDLISRLHRRHFMKKARAIFLWCRWVPQIKMLLELGRK